MMGYGSLSASAKSLALRKWLENWHWPGLPVPILSIAYMMAATSLKKWQAKKWQLVYKQY
jgi:hypothetical protein